MPILFFLHRISALNLNKKQQSPNSSKFYFLLLFSNNQLTTFKIIMYGNSIYNIRKCQVSKVHRQQQKKHFLLKLMFSNVQLFGPSLLLGRTSFSCMLKVFLMARPFRDQPYTWRFCETAWQVLWHASVSSLLPHVYYRCCFVSAGGFLLLCLSCFMLHAVYERDSDCYYKQNDHHKSDWISGWTDRLQN